MRAPGNTEQNRIADCRCYGTLGDIDPNAACRRKFSKEREQQAPGASTQIEKPERLVAPAPPLQDRFHNRFSFGPRVESVGRQCKFKPPKLAFCEDAAQRFASDRSTQRGPHPSDLPILDSAIGMPEELGRRNRERLSDQSPGLAARLRTTGRRQFRGSLAN